MVSPSGVHICSLLSQDLTVTIASERAASEVVLVEDESEISSINVQSFVDEQEWRLHQYVDVWRKQKNEVRGMMMIMMMMMTTMTATMPNDDNNANIS